MAWYSRALNLFRTDRVSRDINREMSFHIAERADELEARGMNRDDAERAASQRFGHRSTLREKTRDVDVLAGVESVINDVRQAARGLRASPGFTVVAVASLALGIGANTAIFSLINAVMVRALPVEHAAELVTVGNKAFDAFNLPFWESIRDSESGLASVTAFNSTRFDLANGGEVRRVAGSWIAGDYFGTLGVAAAAGRLLTRADDRPGCAPLAVLGYGFWQSEYGGAPSAIGRTVSLNGQSFQIAGVAAQGFLGAEVGRSVQVYAPLCARSDLATADLDRLQHTWFLSVIGRVAPGVTSGQVENTLAAMLPTLMAKGYAADQYQDALKDLPAHRFTVTEGVGELSALRQSYASALKVLMIVVGIVLLIGCANVANLLLARAAAREREIAVRFALGASRMRVIRQLLTETMLLTSIGAVAGLFFARWSGSLLVRLLSSGRDAVGLDVPIDGRVLLFTIVVATACALLFGLAPAWRATNTAPQEAMRANARGVAAGHTRFSAGKALVIGQVALSLVLVVGAGLLLGTFTRLSLLNPGFAANNVLLAAVNMQNAGFGDAQLQQQPEVLLPRIAAIPGVVSVSASDLTPISGSGWNGRISVPGYTPKSKGDALLYLNAVSGDFFKTMRTRVVAGRAFGANDRSGTQSVVIINQTAARKFFGDASPVGKTLRMPQGRETPDEGRVLEIVGVVEDAKYASLKELPRSVGYLPISQREDGGASINFEVRTTGGLAPITAAITALVTQVSPQISVEYRRLDNQVAASLTRERLLATLSGFFGVLALLLAMIGLYGTMSYGVSRRRNEIGIRLALGAERARVLRMVLGEVTRILAVGLVLGTAAALAASRYVASFLFGVTPNDALTLASSVLVLAVVALAAGAVPAWRAARLDPMLALRED